MEITFKTKDGKQKLVARDEVQVAAFAHMGLEPATKEDAAKLEKKAE